MGPEDILIIEGIHGLNPKSTVAIPNENKYRIYTSALTSLNIDAHNRIPTSDTRLLRRIVRDYRTRAKSAKMTIREWDKVRSGEEKYIFPYQNNVDAVFNSVLIYEQAVLKQFAEPLLYSITKDESSWTILWAWIPPWSPPTPSAGSLWEADASRCEMRGQTEGVGELQI